MLEIYSEVRAVLSPYVINTIEGCVEDVLHEWVQTANVEKIINNNKMHFLLSGTLDGIVLAHSKLQDFLNDVSFQRNSNEVHIPFTTSSEENCRPKFCDHVISNEIVQGDVSCVPEIIIPSNTENSSMVESSKLCIKPTLRKKRFALKERPRINQRAKSSRLTQKTVRKLKKKQITKNSSISGCLDNDKSGNLNDNLDPKSTLHADFSDFESKKSEQSLNNGQKKLASKKRKDYEAVSPFKHFCELCSFKTKRISHFTKHMAIHEKVTTLYKCSQCSFTSVRLSHLRRHEMTHSSTVHQCTQCHYRTDDVKFLMRHVRLKHHGVRTDKKTSTVLDCPHCPYKTTKQYYFERHQRMHGSENRNSLHQCEQCCYKTHRKEHFVRHVNNVHSNKRPYLCHLCGKAFKRGDALQQHHQTHAESKLAEGMSYRCVKCEKTFRSQSHLFEHQAVHSEVRSFLCEICGASFKTRSVQRKHVLTIHRNPRAYSCEICNKRFNTQYALKRHQKIHDGKVQNGQESEADSEDVPGNFSETGTSDFKPLYIERVTHDLSIHTVTALQVSAGSTDSITVNASNIPAQKAVSGAEVIQHITPTFLQASETTTALLYLTNNLPQY